MRVTSDYLERIVNLSFNFQRYIASMHRNQFDAQVAKKNVYEMTSNKTLHLERPGNREARAEGRLMDKDGETTSDSCY